MTNNLKDNDMHSDRVREINAYQDKDDNKADISERKLSLISDFITSSSNAFDLTEFILSFINSIQKLVDMDLAAYLRHKEAGSLEGNIIASMALGEIELESVKNLLIKKTQYYAGDFSMKTLKSLGFIKHDLLGSSTEYKQVAPDKLHTIELPLKCSGNTVGVLVLFFDMDKTRDFDFTLLEPVVEYACITIERLITFDSSRKSLLENVLSSMNEGLFLVDKSGHPKVLNKKAHELIALACNKKNECLDNGMGLGECPHSILETCEMGWVIKELREHTPDLDGGSYVREIHTENNRDFSLTITNMKEGIEKGGFIISATDITNDKAMQKQLFISNKLSALGEMAAGIAHEVNNPLQIMMGNIDLLDQYIKEDEPGVKNIKDLREGIFKIKTIVNNMLVFARGENMATENIDVNSVITSVNDIVSGQLISSDISIECDLKSRLMPIKCNKDLLQQVIINIIQNAKDSIEEFEKGSLIHIHANEYCDENVVIVITDDGPGIPKEFIDRIFDPFFTTKDVGRGTGLGLSVSRRIIESMGGDIKVSSVEGVGTSFYITLMSGSSKEAYSHGEPQQSNADLSLLLNKKILMVENKELLVDVIKPIINPMVATFDTFTSSYDAHALLLSNEYDIILLDIGTSKMDNMDLYDWIKDQMPHLKDNIIFLANDIVNEKMRGFLSLTGIPTIKKPFETKELLNVMVARIEEKEVIK